MAWTTPITFTTGNVLTAAQMNTYVRDNTNFLNAPPGASVTQGSGNISFATGTSLSATTTGSAFDTKLWDTDSMWTSGSTTLAVNTAGLYIVSFAGEFAANATGVIRKIAVFTGASFSDLIAIDSTQNANAVQVDLTATGLGYGVAAGAGFQPQAAQNTGGTATFTAYPVALFGMFTVQWISAT